MAQGYSSVALGDNAGSSGQRDSSVAIGQYAGNNTQGLGGVALGVSAGETSQKTKSVAIGAYSGQTNQAAESVAIGCRAGNTGQGEFSIAIGRNAGEQLQKTSSIAIGDLAGAYNQGGFSVAIGDGAGQNNQSYYSLAIGSYAGSEYTGVNSIILNGGSVPLNGVSGQSNSLYISPIREDTNQFTPLYYNPSTKEVVRGNTIVDNRLKILNITTSGTYSFPSTSNYLADIIVIGAGSGAVEISTITESATMKRATVAGGAGNIKYYKNVFIPKGASVNTTIGNGGTLIDSRLPYGDIYAGTNWDGRFTGKMMSSYYDYNFYYIDTGAFFGTYTNNNMAFDNLSFPSPAGIINGLCLLGLPGTSTSLTINNGTTITVEGVTGGVIAGFSNNWRWLPDGTLERTDIYLYNTDTFYKLPPTITQPPTPVITTVDPGLSSNINYSLSGTSNHSVLGEISFTNTYADNFAGFERIEHPTENRMSGPGVVPSGGTGSRITITSTDSVIQSILPDLNGRGGDYLQAVGAVSPSTRNNGQVIIAYRPI